MFGGRENKEGMRPRDTCKTVGDRVTTALRGSFYIKSKNKRKGRNEFVFKQKPNHAILKKRSEEW
jgi:hypothetical protein